MRITIFTDSFTPLIDGVVTSTTNLVKNLADRGHKIYIIAPSFNKKFEEFKHKNVKIKRVYSIPAFFYSGYRFTYPFSFKILKYLKKEKIECIHFQTPLALGLQAILISKVLKLPLIGTFHTLFTHPDYIKHIKMGYKPFEKMAWSYARMFYNKCDLITCPSQETKKELLKHGFYRPIKVISNGIDLKMFKNSKCASVKKKYNKNGKLLLFVGRVAHEKNIPYLLKCFKLVLKEVPDTKLLVIGDGPQMEEVKEDIKKFGLSENVILLGKIEHSKLAKSSIFKASDLFVTASITENQPMTMLEAQANGMACVGIKAMGVKDLIKNNYNGFLVKNGNKKEFADKVITLLKNKKLRNKMGKNALNEIKKCEIKNVGDVWENIYSDMIKNYNRLTKTK